MRISDWSSDVCSSDLLRHAHVADSNTDHPAAVVVQGLRGGEAGIDLDAQCFGLRRQPRAHRAEADDEVALVVHARRHDRRLVAAGFGERSEEHTSELQSLMRISYAVFCLKNKK